MIQTQKRVVVHRKRQTRTFMKNKVKFKRHFLFVKHYNLQLLGSKIKINLTGRGKMCVFNNNSNF